MKSAKRIVSIILVVIMLMGILPTAYATDYSALIDVPETNGLYSSEELSTLKRAINSDNEGYDDGWYYYIDTMGKRFVYREKYSSKSSSTEAIAIERTYLTDFPVDQILVVNGLLYYVVEGDIYTLDIETRETTRVLSEEKSITRFAITDDSLFYAVNGCVKAYNLISNETDIVVDKEVTNFWMDDADHVFYITDGKTVFCLDLISEASSSYTNVKSDLGDVLVSASATRGLSLTSLRNKFPHGKYWNHAGNPGAGNSVNNQDGYTTTPCPRHGVVGTSAQTCNGFQPSTTQLSWQCMGYAEKCGYDVTGYNPRNNANGWYTNRSSSALNDLKAGDIVRYKNDGHSIYVIAVNGDTVTYTDCNSDGHCIIRWDATISKTTLRSTFSYVRQAPTTATGEVNNDIPPKWSSWVSDSKMGDPPSSFIQGSTYYLCYKIFGATSGKLLDQVGNYSYSVTETIYFPDGSIANSCTYNNDNNWIGLKCTVSGTYTYKIVLDGDFIGELTGSFTVKANPPTLTPDVSSVSLSMSGTTSKSVTLTTGGYLPYNLSVGGSKDSSAFTAAFDSFEGNTIKMTITGLTNGSGTITVNLKNYDTSEVLASAVISVTVTGTTYTVSYNANGGTGAPAAQTKIYGKDLEISNTVPSGKTYTVSFNANGGVVSTTSLQLSQSFRSWNTTADGSGTSYSAGGLYTANSNATLYAQYEDPSLGSAPTPSRSGYYFMGWYDTTSTDAYGLPTGRLHSSSTRISSNKTLYAIWSKSPLFLWGDYNGDGELTQQDTEGISKVLVGLNDNPDQNKMFRADCNADGLVNDIDLLIVARLINGLEVQSNIPAYKYFNGITVSTLPKTVFSYGEAFSTDGLVLKASYSNGTNYYLTEGYTVSGFDPTIIGTQIISVDFYQYSTEYSIVVTPPQYVLSFDPNGGTVATSQKKVTFNTPIGALPTPTRDGYTFLGWTYTQNSTSYISSSTTFTYLSNKTVYAQWEEGCASGAHNYYESTVAPTCTAQGCNLYICLYCGNTYKDSYVPATGHSYSYYIEAEPSINASGVLKGICNSCGTSINITLPKLSTSDYSYVVVDDSNCITFGTGRYTWKTTTYGTFSFDVTIAKTAHSYVDTVTAPTCTEQGFTTHTCSVCGDDYTDTYTAALGHSYTYAVTTAPTTSAAGVLTGTCSKCGGTTTVTLPKLDTTNYTYTVVTAATCTANGTGRYTWKTTTYGTFAFDVTIPKTAHSYTTTVTQPTCTAQGYTTHTCSVCGDSYKDSYTNALGHSWDAGTVTQEPTETEPGIKTFTCTRCGETKTEPIPATGHTHNYTSTVIAPTCTERGYTIHACSRCDDSYVDSYVEALGHDLGEWAETEAATCTEKGAEKRVCSRCDMFETREIDALGHTEVVDAAVPATCTEAGKTERKHCSVCNTVLVVQEEISALGHKYENGVCVQCGEKDSNEQPTIEFVDVPQKAWYVEAVNYAVRNGLMNGVGNDQFNPEGSMTRAMLVTVLWRYEGEPEGYENTFSDVNSKDGSWYVDAVAWAATNNIVGGVGNGKFDPEGEITREQMATILFRYANWKGIETSKRGDLSAFPDANKISAYAKEAIQWAVAEGIINGSDGKLLPQGNATRAQVATILMRFFENIVNK